MKALANCSGLFRFLLSSHHLWLSFSSLNLSLCGTCTSPMKTPPKRGLYECLLEYTKQASEIVTIAVFSWTGGRRCVDKHVVHEDFHGGLRPRARAVSGVMCKLNALGPDSWPERIRHHTKV